MRPIPRIIAGLVVGSAFIAGIAWWLLPAWSGPGATNKTSPLSGPVAVVADKTAAPPPGATLLEPRASGIYLLPGSEELSARLQAPSRNPVEDIEVLTELLSLYRKATGGEMPLAPDNRVVVAHLQGANDRKLAVLPESGLAGLAGGELRDRWGTPYFFHALSAAHMEIRSAGADRKWATSDDVTLPQAEE